MGPIAATHNQQFGSDSLGCKSLDTIEFNRARV